MRGRAPEAITDLRRHLDRSLFKAVPEDAARHPAGQRAVAVIALLALAVVLQLFRVGPGTALDSLWAEDGPIFLQGALQHGAWTDLWTTYGGYLVFAPRLVGLLAEPLPLHDAAAAMAIISTLLVGLSGLAVWFASAGHLRDPYLRGILVALTVLAPTASLESVASGTYASWYMVFAVFWLLLWRPRTTLGALLGGAFVLLTALSNPAVLFLAPLVALRALAIDDRRDSILVGAWTLGSVTQIAAMLLQSEPQVAPLWSRDIWVAYLQRVLDGAAFGERLGGAAWEVLGWPLLIALLVLGAFGLWLGLREVRGGARWLAALALPISLALFVVAVYQRAVGPQMRWPTGDFSGAAGRYTIVSALLLVSVALVLIEGVRAGRPALGRWLAAGAAALLLAGLAISFDVRDTAARGTPPWGTALDAAAAECRAEGAIAVTVPISPPPFAMSVPCGRATGG